MTKLTQPFNIEPESLTDTTNGITQFPFGKLIGNILTACVDAQTKAANVAWEYTQQVLKRSETPMVFTFQDSDKQVRRISVPLITIVPLPYMRLDNVDIDFDATVNVTNSSKEQFVVKMNSTESSGSAVQTEEGETNLHININAGTEDMPAGLASLLNFINNGMVIEMRPNNPPSRPGSSRPGSSRPGSSYPASSRPGSSRPGSSYPASSRPGSSRPGSSYPASSRPGSSRPISSGSSRPISSGSSRPISSGSSRPISSSAYTSQARTTSTTNQKSGQTTNSNPVKKVVPPVIHNIAEKAREAAQNPGSTNPRRPNKRAKTVLKASMSLTPFEVTDLSKNPLLALHVNWTRPTLMGNPDWKYGTDDFEIISTVLSAMLWRKFNGPIKLYTDKEGLEFYNSLGMTDLWNGGIDSTTLTRIPQSVPADIFWAAGKIYAIRKEEAPFVMMDTDLMVWDSIAPYIKGRKLMAYHPEDLYDFYLPYEQLKKPEGYTLNKKWDWSLNPYNTALTYFANDEDTANFKKAYTQQAIKFMTNNVERPEEMVSQMVFAEQRLFSMIASLNVGYPVPTFLDYMDQEGKPFTHLWGIKYDARSDEQVQHDLCVALGQAIRQNFPDVRLSNPREELINKYC